MDVVFYSSLYVAILSSILAAAILYKLSFFSAFSGFEKKQMVLIWILLGYIFAISGKTATAWWRYQARQVQLHFHYRIYARTPVG